MADIEDKIVNKIKERVPNVLAIYIFGSFGTAHQTAESDVDIAVLMPKKMDPLTLWDTAQQIAIELNKDVDLIDLKGASTVFQNQIISTGKRIYCSDKISCDLFEHTCLSMYLRFNEERKDFIRGVMNG